MSDGFVIRLDETASLVSTRSVSLPGFVDMDAVNSLFQQILEKARELLVANLPEWPIVEAGIRAAYNLYIRPRALPDFIDNVLCDALVYQVKRFYDSLG